MLLILTRLLRLEYWRQRFFLLPIRCFLNSRLSAVLPSSLPRLQIMLSKPRDLRLVGSLLPYFLVLTVSLHDLAHDHGVI